MNIGICSVFKVAEVSGGGDDGEYGGCCKWGGGGGEGRRRGTCVGWGII